MERKKKQKRLKGEERGKRDNKREEKEGRKDERERERERERENKGKNNEEKEEKNTLLISLIFVAVSLTVFVSSLLFFFVSEDSVGEQRYTVKKHDEERKNEEAIPLEAFVA